MQIKSFLLILIAVSLLQAGYQTGETIEDFSFQDVNLVNGQTVISERSVSQLLAEGKLVFLNFFGTSCASCNQEAVELRDLWNTWQANQPGKLHITGGCNTAAYNFDQLNGSIWRTKFNPPLSYNLSTYQSLGHKLSQFTGTVPLNVLIGGGRRIEYIGSILPSATKIAEAVMSVSLFVVNQPQNRVILFGQLNALDLTGSFTSTTGHSISYQIDSLSAPGLLTAGFNGNILQLQAGSTAGECKIKIKATSGSIYNYTTFTVQIQDPAAEELLCVDFASFPPTGWTSNGWQQANNGQSGKCAIAKYQPAGEKMLTASQITLNTQEPQLSFYWKNNDVTKISGHDTTFAEISTNGQNWQRLALLSAIQQQSSFVKEEVDLSAYQNQNIQLRWRYKTDGHSQAYGTALDQVKISGRTAIAERVDYSKELKVECYPNPFNNSSQISYRLNSSSNVKLTIYNAAGKEVRELVNQHQPAGWHGINFAANEINSGLLFYRLNSDNQVVSGKLLLVK